jgi:MFS family permease
MSNSRLITPVLIGGAIILMLSFSVRASFGVFQIPIASEFGWPRTEFSLAIAIQNLAWGIGQPIFGALAERFGDRRAIILGAVLYAAGLVLSAFAVTPLQHQFLEILVGFGIAGTGFGVILAVVGRATSDEHRSLALGIATAAGSAGQVFGAPVAAALLNAFPWQTVFIIFAVVIMASLLALPMLRAPVRATRVELAESMGTVLMRAFRDPSYTLIFLGFFSCGYQLGFITAHFPAMVTEMCGDFRHRSGQYRGHDLRGLGGQALEQEIPAGRDLSGAHGGGGGLHPAADDACLGADLLAADGGAVAGHGAADLGAGRAYLRAALHGHAVWVCLPQPPDRRVPGGLAGRQAL